MAELIDNDIQEKSSLFVIGNEGDTYLEYSENYHRERKFKGIKNEILHFLVKNSKPKNVILPQNVLWVSKNRSQVIVTEEPRLRNITARFARAPECQCVWSSPDENGHDEIIETCGVCLNGSHDGDSIDDFSLSEDEWSSFWLYIPRMVYYFSISSSFLTLRRILCTLDEEVSEDTLMSTLPLPNLYRDGSTCAGNTNMQSEHNYECISQAMNTCIDAFWSSAFNYDIQEFKDSNVWKILASNVTEYWKDAEIFRFWESLTPEEVYALLPWEKDVQENGSISSILNMLDDDDDVGGSRFSFYRTIASVVYRNSL